MQNDLEKLNELVITYNHEIEITKKLNEHKSIIRLFKPSNLSEFDNEKISNLNISQQTLFSLVSIEQTTFNENNTITAFEPNNIFNFVMKNYRIIIAKNKYENNISAKIYSESELIDEIFSTNMATLIEKLEFYCSQ